MITTCTDASIINAIINNPDVHKWVSLGGQGYIDATELIAAPNICLLADDVGCFICVRLEPGVYEVHTNFLQPGRGRLALKAAKDAAEYMFIHTDCMEILTKVPVDNVAADIFARNVGFTFEFCRTKAFQRKEMVDVRYYAWRFYDWMRQVDFSDVGEWFHERLGDDKNHDDDHVHDHYAGMATMMIQAGNIDKGVILYNRWARFAGYLPISIASYDPLIIDIQTCRLVVKDGDFFVEGETCQ